MKKYRELGIKLTPQRLAILEYLDGNRTHPSAEDIYRVVSKQFPTMSLATVYNTLEALRDKGTVRELKINRSKRRYDPNVVHHHHLICVKCKVIHDVKKEFKLTVPEDMTKDFDLIGNSIEFYGICQKCKKKMHDTRCIKIVKGLW